MVPIWLLTFQVKMRELEKENRKLLENKMSINKMISKKI